MDSSRICIQIQDNFLKIGSGNERKILLTWTKNVGTEILLTWTSNSCDFRALYFSLNWHSAKIPRLSHSHSSAPIFHSGALDLGVNPVKKKPNRDWDASENLVISYSQVNHQERKMTKVATAGQLPESNALHFGAGAAGGGVAKITTNILKRKTPSELRGELLKRKPLLEAVGESPSFTSVKRNVDGDVCGPRKCDSSKGARFTRMDDHFPVTKSNKLLFRKDNPKETVPNKFASSQLNSVASMSLRPKIQEPDSCVWDSTAPECANDSSNLSNKSGQKFNSNFKSVRELSLGGDKLNCSSSVDMSKALKGLVSCEPQVSSPPLKESIAREGNNGAQSLSSVLVTPGQKVSLDLTLKTSMRLLSSSSVNWFHRLVNCATLDYRPLFSHVGSEPIFTRQIKNVGALHSWVHPQCILPREAVQALASSPGGQMEFFSKRQHAWEDSFRSLYYMLRRKTCKIFYVCSVQFVVMFTASDGPIRTKLSCYAYISQSTRNLRSLLKEHDVVFSMPLCHSKVEEVTAEDLVELSEIGKHNLGQTRAVEAIAGVDNTAQSLLMFTGNKNVHALYNFLLNYRSFLTTLTGGDVPVLYSPVPFDNASLSAPEVKCKQVRRVDNMSFQPKDTFMDSEHTNSSAGICYSVEIRDAYLPPWVICGICDVMLANGADFEASFVTELTSIGLNVGMDTAWDPTAQQVNAGDKFQESGQNFGISNTILSLKNYSAYLKGLKYGDGSYTAFLSFVE